eukprot:CAMPEP_0206612784 /NCGR_PEP_ID=MMETSP0325_2-20121206/56233_1 /ASSEMBLY_ACC=CAM_ASM_000347 /TAXON_ID=2866 /ORGANISM="Crypthecodinium cohnii, Strain Seligo" /LENGTH=336 /DNA_ID=CAMNT_0054132617 /DNA_START=28 /DNA_END=1035 /DNA_ORIENTATION=+
MEVPPFTPRCVSETPQRNVRPEDLGGDALLPAPRYRARTASVGALVKSRAVAKLQAMEDRLQWCEAELDALDAAIGDLGIRCSSNNNDDSNDNTNTNSNTSNTNTSSSNNISKEDRETRSREDRRRERRELTQRWETLTTNLADLAEEALEHGCNREVPGAMELYARANRAIDQVSEVAERHRGFVVASLGPFSSPSRRLPSIVLEEEMEGTTSVEGTLSTAKAPGANSAAASAVGGDPTTGYMGGERASLIEGRSKRAQDMENQMTGIMGCLVHAFCSVACGCWAGLRQFEKSLREPAPARASTVAVGLCAAISPADVSAARDAAPSIVTPFLEP